MRFSVTSPVQNALFRRVRFSSPAQTWSHLTQRRILRRRSHVKAQSAPATPPRRDRRAHSGRATSRKARSACGRWLRREAIFADLCTLLRTHGRSRDRAGPRAPRYRGPHGPRDARALGPEAHATGAVTQPPTRAHEASIFHAEKQARQFMLWPAHTLVTCTRFELVVSDSKGAQVSAVPTRSYPARRACRQGPRRCRRPSDCRSSHHRAPRPSDHPRPCRCARYRPRAACHR